MRGCHPLLIHMSSNVLYAVKRSDVSIIWLVYEYIGTQFKTAIYKTKLVISEHMQSIQAT